MRLASGVKKVGAGWPALVCWEEVGMVWTSPSRLELLVLLGCRWKRGACYLAQRYTNCCDEASFQSSELAPSLCHLTPLLWWEGLGSQTVGWSFGQQRWPGASLRGSYGGSWCLCESLKQWFYLRRQESHQNAVNQQRGEVRPSLTGEKISKLARPMTGWSSHSLFSISKLAASERQHQSQNERTTEQTGFFIYLVTLQMYLQLLPQPSSLKKKQQKQSNMLWIWN